MTRYRHVVKNSDDFAGCFIQYHGLAQRIFFTEILMGDTFADGNCIRVTKRAVGISFDYRNRKYLEKGAVGPDHIVFANTFFGMLPLYEEMPRAPETYHGFNLGIFIHQGVRHRSWRYSHSVVIA